MIAHEGPQPGRRRLGAAAVVVLVVVAFAVTVAIGLVRSQGAVQPAAAIRLSVSPAPTPTLSAVYVHVAGAVRAPGLYAVEAGSRVMDAIAAAGGFAGDADRAAVNLARAVVDGEQIIVAVQGAAPAASAAAGGAAGGAAAGPIDLNTADAAALETLPRIGPALAARIVDWRTRNGRFTSVDDLLAVPGIGQRLLDGLRELVRV